MRTIHMSPIHVVGSRGGKVEPVAEMCPCCCCAEEERRGAQPQGRVHDVHPSAQRDRLSPPGPRPDQRHSGQSHQMVHRLHTFFYLERREYHVVLHLICSLVNQSVSVQPVIIIVMFKVMFTNSGL